MPKCTLSEDLKGFNNKPFDYASVQNLKQTKNLKKVEAGPFNPFIVMDLIYLQLFYYEN